MCTTYPYRESTDKQGRPVFYARFRTLRLQDGTPITVQLTRYTYGYGKRPVVGPRGGQNYQRFARCVYYADGVFYKAENFKDSQGHWFNGLSPIWGTIWDCHPRYTAERRDAPCVSISCDAGHPEQVFGDGICYWSDLQDGIGYLEALLHLDRKPRAGKAA